MTKLKPHKHIVQLIQSGGATESTLISNVGLKNRKALFAQFKVLRDYFDLYPVEQQDGTYVLLDEDAYAKQEQVMDSIKAAALAKRKEEAELKKIIEKDPQRMLDAAIRKRENKLDKLDAAVLKSSKLPNNQLTALRYEKADIEFRIADYELTEMREQLCKFYRLDSLQDLENLRAQTLLNKRADEILRSEVNESAA